MNKLIILALILVSAFAFSVNDAPIISEEAHRQLKAINWPFTTCGDGKWDITKLTLGPTPARNTHDSIDVVTYSPYFRLEKPETPLPSRTSSWMSSWMGLLSTLKPLLSLTHSTTETQLSSSSTTSFHHSPPQEPTDWLSNLLTTREQTTDVCLCNSNCDLDINFYFLIFAFLKKLCIYKEGCYKKNEFCWAKRKIFFDSDEINFFND